MTEIEWVDLAKSVFDTLKIASGDLISIYTKSIVTTSYLNIIGSIIGIITIPLISKKIISKIIKKLDKKGYSYSEWCVMCYIFVPFVVGLLIWLFLSILCGDINCILNPEYCAITNLIESVI